MRPGRTNRGSLPQEKSLVLALGQDSAALRTGREAAPDPHGSSYQGSTFLLSSSHPLSLGDPAVLSLSHPPPPPSLGENFTNKRSFFGKAKGSGEDSSTWLSEHFKSKQTRRLWEALASCPSSGWQLGNVRLAQLRVVPSGNSLWLLQQL